jgi:hypothetical protein
MKMKRSDLQKELKKLRDSGRNINVKLNAANYILESELKRLQQPQTGFVLVGSSDVETLNIQELKDQHREKVNEKRAYLQNIKDENFAQRKWKITKELLGELVNAELSFLKRARGYGKINKHDVINFENIDKYYDKTEQFINEIMMKTGPIKSQLIVKCVLNRVGVENSHRTYTFKN